MNGMVPVTLVAGSRTSSHLRTRHGVTMRLPVSSLSILILVACAPSANPPAPDRTRIEIELPISKEKAYDRLYRAFIEEGMNIATASPISASLMPSAKYS